MTQHDRLTGEALVVAAFSLMHHARFDRRFRAEMVHAVDDSNHAAGAYTDSAAGACDGRARAPRGIEDAFVLTRGYGPTVRVKCHTS